MATFFVHKIPFVAYVLIAIFRRDCNNVRSIKALTWPTVKSAYDPFVLTERLSGGFGVRLNSDEFYAVYIVYLLNIERRL